MEILTEQLKKDFKVEGEPWLSQLKSSAFENFISKGYPSTRAEDWRYTNVTSLTQTSFHLTKESKPHVKSPSPLPEGVIVENLAYMLETRPDFVRPYLSRFAEDQSQPFVTLNTAFLHEGLFIFIPKGQIIPEPIHFVYEPSLDSEVQVSHPRNLIVVEEGAEVSLVEIYKGEGHYWTNAVTEIIAGPRTHISHCKIQQEGNEATHFSTLSVHQDRDSYFSSHVFSFGGDLVRNHIQVVLNEEGSECVLNGLFMGTGKQHVDNQTTIDHVQPHTSSRESYKGVLDGQAQGVFNGQIIVRPNAQKVQAEQSNKNLLLSDKAEINTKPNLEIYANDVKCSHGATIGRIDDNQLFYLKSRGVGEEEAKNILTYAFASDVIQKVPEESLKQELEDFLLSKMKEGK